MVEASPFPNLEQITARYLARCDAALTPALLRDGFAAREHRTTGAELRRTMSAHRAFTRLPGDRYTAGRTAQLACGIRP
ncbi:hypothetical protein ACFVRU_51515 [Streptomyces sp. NPDC057927]